MLVCEHVVYINLLNDAVTSVSCTANHLLYTCNHEYDYHYDSMIMSSLYSN